MTDPRSNAAHGCDRGCWDYQQLKAERDRYRKALGVLADTENWGGDPRSPEAVLYGHDTPYELAREALAPERPAHGPLP